MNPDRCRGCGAELIWAITREDRTAPITREPKPNGNVLIFRAPHRTLGPGDAVQCRTFAGFALDELREQGVPLRLNHFADCPERQQFER